ncbi:hypothetical protein [Rhizobium rhizogenes]|uniref:hypothetical protein n=1 Tax=Rhizobium rhizogenes TaxID=359 RepID=UPI001574EC19|nr:hypothetical protein [Rhizobium rhizogenes]NTI36100.1 hypothetical protein [Rhizobium rhizogenes]WEO64057.1 hypothetical protein G6L54_013300 [Rhizobium rhizogenes]
MIFPIDPFAEAIARTLQAKGFVRTATIILLTIADGYLDGAGEGSETRRAYTSFEQQQVCADLIEQNIIFPYAAWEACALQLGEEELIPDTWIGERNLEKRLLVTTAAGGARQLGSFSYRKSIENLRDTVNRLRGMDPPAPGGGSPPSPPRGGGGTAVSTRFVGVQKSGPYEISTLFEAGDDVVGPVTKRSLDERLPFSKVSPVLAYRKQLAVTQITKDRQIAENVEAAEGTEDKEFDTGYEEDHGFKA